MKLAALASALAVAAPTPLAYVASREQPGGGFSEPGGPTDTSLTAWAILALRASGEKPSVRSIQFLLGQDEDEIGQAALVALALGPDESKPYLVRLRGAERKDGAIGENLASTYWSMLALAPDIPADAVKYVLAHQAASGGWSWNAKAAPDSNDTAVAIEALRAAGVTGTPIGRGVAFLLRFHGRDGGFSLTKARPSDSQSTAWAIQALIAAGGKPPKNAFTFLARMRKADGSYRYSARFATTPLWVTSQVIPALEGKPFPLR